MSLTALAVFIVYVLGLVLAFSYEPIFALYSYLWIFYNDPTTSWWGRDLPEFRYSLVAALGALIAAVRLSHRQTIPWASLGVSRLLIAFTAWIWLEMFWAINPSVHMDGVVLCTKYLILSYVIYQLTPTARYIELFLWAHLGGCFLFGMKALFTDVEGRLETVGGPGVDDANLLAAHMVTGLVIAGVFFVGQRGIRRWLAFGALPFILNAIILTQSRGGFVALVAAGASAWYLSPKVNRRAVLIAGVLAAGLIGMLGNDAFWERVQTIAGDKSNTSEETRVQILGPQLQMFKDHPFGAGYRGNAILSPRYMPVELLSSSGVRSAHNTFMAALVDQGFPGAIMLVSLYVWAFLKIRALRALDEKGLPHELGLFRAAIGAALTGCFAAGMFLNMLTSEVQIWLLFILASLTSLAQKTLAEAAGGSTNETAVEQPHKRKNQPLALPRPFPVGPQRPRLPTSGLPRPLRPRPKTDAKP